MEEHLIHKFSQKLLQGSVFPYFKKYLDWRSGLKSDSGDYFPMSINLDLITSCTFRCPHCIDQRVTNTGKMLDLQYVRTFLRDWSKKGLKSVILIGGGEPTLYPYFEDVVKLLKILSLQVGIVSNGTNLKKIENICHLLGKKDWVRLSIDAGNNETFQKIHHPQIKITLEAIAAGAQKISQKNPALQLGYSFLIIGDDKKAGGVRLEKNIGEIVLAAKLAKESGFSYLSLKPFLDPTASSRGATINKRNLQEITIAVKEAKKLEDKNFKVVESNNLLCFYDKNLKQLMQNKSKICHTQFFHSVVSPIGIYNCPSWRGFPRSKITDADHKDATQYYQQFQQNRQKMVDDFPAGKICKNATCLHASLNRWIEDLVRCPNKIKKLKPIDDFEDYFL